ncbi:hypothetical protein H112_01139 [Trichophyton rubrum D6]|uniref:Uncharacterized protein n=2 Tax=Trichophyton TaxID=5550 RepID=A0A022WEK6_TRIRU|nr:hypothetical protein H100_01138 [Trichophyton rubrum MR850]EZF56518.1 hypothetical protein H103_01136 [Trichophyton rubrum CBS 288.86]EZF67102.1 hypothetical protein H104_01122 [Trichophyton rubrum CBS 289.86]EZF77864.1 hypothetical protein H105_01142 [Trichophyton soudanense CBS 452.61]EZF88449.1 hypothetical protein H110_01139 [Trichophyton rubrum MR1448]EZF99261.1 hypothetical protein H113_01139 [Trichophyton rubrum MR1459]EZG10225.1 hypothetical protein H106_00936 [Trichophyton rubrum 
MPEINISAGRMIDYALVDIVPCTGTQYSYPWPTAHLLDGFAPRAINPQARCRPGFRLYVGRRRDKAERHTNRFVHGT